MNTVEEKDIARRLSDLEPLAPDRDAWTRVRRRAVFEGLLSADRGPARRYQRYGFVAALAASVAVVAVVMTLQTANDDTRDAATPIVSSAYVDGEATAQRQVLEDLMTQSQLLERELRRFPGGPRVVRTSTASSVNALQDRISLLDQNLNLSGDKMSPEQASALWSERVTLLDELLRTQYAHAGHVIY